MATIRNDFTGTVVAVNAEGDVLSLTKGQTIPTGFWVAGSAVQGGDAGDVRLPWYRDPSAGTKGPKGDTGPAGTDGAPGTPGTNGINGTAGAAGTITAVTATGLAAGATPTVTLGGTASARTIALGIPKGDKGEPGTPA